VVATSAVGVLGAFAPEAELNPHLVWWDGVLGGLEHFGRGWGRGFLHCLEYY
jgi:hypothetical protein